MKKILLFIALIFFGFFSSAHSADFTFYENFEDETVDTAWPYTSGDQLWDTGAGGDCEQLVEDDVTPRFGSQYLSLYCDWTDMATFVSDGGKLRTGTIFHNSNLLDGTKCMTVNTDTEYWIGFSMYIPVGYIAEYFAHQMIQFYQSGEGPCFSINYGADTDNTAAPGVYRISAWYGTGNHVDKTIDWTQDRGTWVDWVIRAIFYNTDNENAGYTVWRNGVIAYNHYGDNNVLGGGGTNGPYIEPNIYNISISVYGVSQPEPTAQFRQEHMDEFRVTGANIATYDYCDVAPPIWGAKPTISYPAEDAEDVPVAFTALFDAYSDHHTEGDQNCYTAYQMDVQINESSDGDFTTTLLVDHSDITSSNQNDIEAGDSLAENTEYIMRVRQCSYNSDRSTEYCGDWSDTRTFTTEPPAEVASGNPTGAGGSFTGGGTY